MSYRKLFYVANVLLLAVFVWALVEDFRAEWRPYQAAYYRMAAEAQEKLAAAQTDPKKAAEHKAAARAMRRSPVEIKQIIVGDLGRFDRCVTCHVGMDEYTNPSLKNDFTENPYKAHPKIDESLVKAHPFTKFGCTSCHSGQGLATDKDAAHGWVKHWEKPMLKGVHIQGACVKCHGDFETLKGSEVAARGKRLFQEHGCQGCHAINGWGGAVSVDLGDVADKPFERIAGYNFKRVRIDGKELPNEHHNSHWNIQNWILGHLVNDPAYNTPNDPFAKLNAEPIPPSGMPDFSAEISRADSDAITAYLTGMTKEEVIPRRYYVFAPAAREPKFSQAKDHGRFVFQKYGCQGCHGLEAKEGRRRYNALGPGQKPFDETMTEEEIGRQMELGREPTLPDLMGTYTHEELVKKIASGVPAADAKKWNPKGPMPMIYMPGWKDKISPTELNDLATWLLSIAKEDDSGF
ncbi:MAG: c-type cytochrome [Elusimicrobiota bacterium]